MSIVTRQLPLPLPPVPARARPRGFSLLELIVVIALIAIVAAVALPNLAAQVQGSAVRSVVMDIMSLSKQARSLAALKGSPCELVLDPEERRMRLAWSAANKTNEEKSTASLESDVQFSTVEKAQGDIQSAMARRQVPASVKITRDGRESAASIIFYPDGTAEECQLKVLGAGGREVWVKISGPSGKASVVATRAN